MAYSIFDKFLTVADCKYYCNQIATRLNLNTYDYFYDKGSETKFPGNSVISSFAEFRQYEKWKIKFNLNRPATIKKMGLDEYVLRYHELSFHLTIRGYSFIYVCKFSNPKQIERGKLDDNTKTIYIEETGGQYSFLTKEVM